MKSNRILLWIVLCIFSVGPSFAGWINLDGTPEQNGPNINLDYSDYDSTIITVGLSGN